MKSPSFAKFDPKLKKDLIKNEQERQEKAKRDQQDESQREMEEFKNSGKGTASNVIFPEYTHDDVLDCDREAKPGPPESLYIGLGWDENKDTKRKHYRRFFTDELENVKKVLTIASPF